MVKKPQDREAAARKLAEGVGGKLHHLFFAFGDEDVYALIEAPDDRRWPRPRWSSARLARCRAARRSRALDLSRAVGEEGRSHFLLFCSVRFGGVGKQAQNTYLRCG